jgi:hypothetical protein
MAAICGARPKTLMWSSTAGTSSGESHLHVAPSGHRAPQRKVHTSVVHPSFDKILPGLGAAPGGASLAARPLPRKRRLVPRAQAVEHRRDAIESESERASASDSESEIRLRDRTPTSGIRIGLGLGAEPLGGRSAMARGPRQKTRAFRTPAARRLLSPQAAKQTVPGCAKGDPIVANRAPKRVRRASRRLWAHAM